MQTESTTPVPDAVVQDALRELPIALAKDATPYSGWGQSSIEVETDGRTIHVAYNAVLSKLWALVGVNRPAESVAGILNDAIERGLFVVTEGTFDGAGCTMLRSTPKLWEEPFRGWSNPKSPATWRSIFAAVCGDRISASTWGRMRLNKEIRTSPDSTSRRVKIDLRDLPPGYKDG